jgi:hypothetical protein
MIRTLQPCIDKKFPSTRTQFHTDGNIPPTKGRGYRRELTPQQQRAYKYIMSNSEISDIQETQLQDSVYVDSLRVDENWRDIGGELSCREKLPTISTLGEDRREQDEEQQQKHGGLSLLRDRYMGTSTIDGEEQESEGRLLYGETLPRLSNSDGERVETQEKVGLERVFVFIVRKDSVERMGYRHGFSRSS